MKTDQIKDRRSIPTDMQTTAEAPQADTMAVLADAIASSDNQCKKVEADALLMLKFAPNPPISERKQEMGKLQIKSSRIFKQLPSRGEGQSFQTQAPSQRRYLSAKSVSGFLGVKRTHNLRFKANLRFERGSLRSDKVWPRLGSG
jgi:hypothetical protein